MGEKSLLKSMGIGNPEPLIHGGIWPRSCGKEERKKLKKRAKSLPLVTIHGTPFDLNIAANNPGIREESIRQYEEAMDLAKDIECKTVTYHRGRPPRQNVYERKKGNETRIDLESSVDDEFSKPCADANHNCAGR